MTAAILLALALAAGALDAASYLGLGHVFTANMTGNTVLLGIAAVRGDGTQAIRSSIALAGFSAGVALGVGLIRHHSRWPARARVPLGLEALLLALLLGLWAALGTAGRHGWLIAISGLAMGVQSAAVRSSDVRGVNTTYMTSTLQNAIARVIIRLRAGEQSAPGPELPGTAWALYAVGALAGAAVERSWHAVAIVIPLAVLTAVGLAALAGAGEHR